MKDELIQIEASARLACERMSPSHMAALRDNFEEACQLPADTGWARKASAHAEFFTILAEAAKDTTVARVLLDGRGLAYGLMIAAGRGADRIVINSRRRVLEYLRIGDSDSAALELEKHLRILRVMWRLSDPNAQRAPT